MSIPAKTKLPKPKRMARKGKTLDDFEGEAGVGEGEDGISTDSDNTWGEIVEISVGMEVIVDLRVGIKVGFGVDGTGT